MQTALTRVVEAQARHFEDHNHYADSIPVLEEYGFRPVEDTHVALNFQGTEPQWGYLATAVHTFSNQRCEVLHGRATDGREFAGQIECTTEGAVGPSPGTPGAESQPGVSPRPDLPPGQTSPPGQPGAPTTEVDPAPGATPPQQP